MKPSVEIAKRMQTMLVRDKLGVGEGFLEVFKKELSRLVKDYFVLDKEPSVKVELLDNGKYDVEIILTASATKGFATTKELV